MDCGLPFGVVMFLITNKIVTFTYYFNLPLLILPYHILRSMKILLRFTLFVILSYAGSHPLFAQGVAPVEAPPAYQPTTLQEQFVYLKEQSSTYKNKKIIREARLNQLWTNVQDSLAQVQNKLTVTQGKIGAQNEEISSLNEKLQEQQQAVSDSEHASTHISVLGIDMLKQNFLSFFWITASILTLLLLGALYQYRNSKLVTSKTQYNLRAIQRELEDFRKKSLEKERKLRRELQTERNRVEELKLVASQKR